MNKLRKRNAKMQQELKEAAKDMRGLSAESLCTVVSNSVGPIVAHPSAIPSKPSIRFDAHDGVVSAVKWSPVDRVVATGGEDRKVKLWDVSKGVAECKGMLIGSNAGVMSVDFDSTGGQIVAASNDLASRVWTVSDQRLRHTLTGHCAKVMAAKFMGEPNKVVTGSHDRTLKIYDLRIRACVETKFAGSSCNDLVTSETIGTTIISGHFDKRIRFWDTRTETPHTDIEVQGRVTSLDLSRDCNYLLSCVRDDTLRLIDLRTNKIINTFEVDGFKVGCDWTRAVFNLEYDHVAVGSSDGSVFIWNVTKPGRPLVVLRNEHSSPVTAVSWHQFTNHVASVDRSRRAVVWADV
ncbi:autophagy-related protein 16-1-like [Daktulosphaira vitifoliae]|uniref:autophagy-related protein 16-1-like n=1 Tax=Daktulosphaira vitifoliae TaxID=58002 RepID=UPI0021AA826F|nr:autophagy-related protein 16-1-like [Daktulosphaira vitifoliae]